MRRTRTNVVCASFVCAILVIVYFSGILDHAMEKSFLLEFEYPLNENVLKLAMQVRLGIEPDTAPINVYKHPFLSRCERKCSDTPPRLLILVKSAMEHFERRNAIRRTWGSEHRFRDVAIRTVFFLGVQGVPDRSLQERIDREQLANGDIVQSHFIDSYFNNTIKTMMAFRWAWENCAQADFYLFADDDMFISVKNVLMFVEDPLNYLSVEKELNMKALVDLKQGVVEKISADGVRIISAPYAKYSVVRRALKVPGKMNIDGLFTGFVFKSSPHRHLSSKWKVSLEEYPYDMWPPYVTAGAYILSNEALKTMYAGSMFVKHFRFDDIYLGIVALKVGIVPFHCKEFYFYKKPYDVRSYNNIIASHGYHDPEELQRVWQQQLTGAKV